MISMDDIAEKAGVSRSTVSLVLNRRQASVRISEATSRRILSAAADLGYRPNEMARAVATGKNHVIGFLTFHPAVEFVAAMLAGALEEADTQGYLVKVMRLGSDQDANHRIIQRCVESRLAGVVAIYLPADLQAELARYDIPIAHLDSSSEGSKGVHVLSEDRGGSALAVDHLVSLGHRRIAFLGGESGLTTSRLREEGYLQGMSTHGLEVRPQDIRYAGWEPEGTMAAVREILTAPDSAPTAIFCTSDFIAMATLRAIRSLKLRVPEDISVVGFADLSLARYADPPLTTVAQPFAEMGRVAVRGLLTEGDPETSSSDSDQTLPTTLIVRESTTFAKSV